MAVREIAGRIAMALDGLGLVAVGTRPLSYFCTKTEELAVIKVDKMNELHGGILAGRATWYS